MLQRTTWPLRILAPIKTQKSQKENLKEIQSDEREHREIKEGYKWEYWGKEIGEEEENESWVDR